MVVISMTDGLIFYWLSWAFWIVITFIMEKGRPRTLLACWLLVALLVSNIYFTIEGFDISLTFLVLLVGVIALQVLINHSIYQIFASFILMTGYIAMLLWENFAPIWLFLPRFILIPLFCVIILHFLFKNASNKIAAGLFGICAGEIIYSFILSSYDLSEAIGEMAFLDLVIVTVAFIICVELLKKGKQKFSLLFSSYHSDKKIGEPLPKTVLNRSMQQ